MVILSPCWSLLGLEGDGGAELIGELGGDLSMADVGDFAEDERVVARRCLLSHALAANVFPSALLE